MTRNPREEMEHSARVMGKRPMDAARDRLQTLRERRDEAVAAMNSLVRERAYTLEFRREKLAKLRADHSAALAEQGRAWRDALAQDRPALYGRANPPTAPDPALAAQFIYVRDLLAARFANGRGDLAHAEAVAATWRRALDQGDLVTAKVLADHLEVWWPTTRRAVDPEGREFDATNPLPSNVGFDELIARTEQALTTPDQRAAREQLAELDQVLADFDQFTEKECAALARMDVNPETGALEDGAVLARRRALRQRFGSG